MIPHRSPLFTPPIVHDQRDTFDPDAFVRQQRERAQGYQAMQAGLKDNMAPLGSGSIWEGLARAGKSFIDTRAAKEQAQQQEAQRQRLSEILAGSGGDRTKIFEGLASDPAFAEQALGVLPPPVKLEQADLGGAKTTFNPTTGEYGAAPVQKTADPEARPWTGAIKDKNGVWVYDPNYLKGQKEIYGARVTAGLPGRPTAPPGTYIPGGQ